MNWIPRKLATADNRMLVGLLVSPLLIGSPFLFFRYGLTDDYSMLMSARRYPGAMIDEIVGVGRLIYGPVREWSSLLIGDVDNLVWARAVSLIGLGLLGLLLTWHSRRTGWNRTASLLAGAFLLASPSASVLGGWATCWPYPFAACLAVFAFFASHRVFLSWGGWPSSLELKHSGFHWSNLVLLFASTLAIVAAAFVYQPYAFFYVVPLMACLLVAENNRSWRRILALGALHLAWLFFCLVLSFLIYRGFIDVTSFEIGGRTELTTQPGAKVKWLVTSVLPNGLNLFTLRGHRGEGTIVFLMFGLVAACLPVARLLKEWSARGPSASLALAGMMIGVSLASVSLLLVIRESYASYRVLFPLAALNAMMLAWGWEGIFDGPLFRRLRVPVTIVIILLAATCAWWRNYSLIAEPQARELAIMENALSEMPWGSEHSIFVLQPTMNDSLASIVTTNEFGLPSTYADWAVEGMVWLYSQREARVGGYSLVYSRTPPENRAAFEHLIDLPARFAANRGAGASSE